MAANVQIGALTARLLLDSHPWERELSRAEKQAQQFRQRMAKETGASFLKMRQAMGGTAADANAFKQVGMSTLDRRMGEAIAPIRQLRRADVDAISGGVDFRQQLQSLERFGKVAMGANAAIAAMRATTAAWKHDWDGVQEAINRLPFGIGQMAEAVASWKAEWTAAKAEIEGNLQRAAQQDRDVLFNRRAFDSVREAVEESDLAVRRLNGELAGLGKTGLDKTLHDIATSSGMTVMGLIRSRDAALRRSGLDESDVRRRQLEAPFNEQIEAERRLARARMRQEEIDEFNRQAEESRRRRRELELEGLQTRRTAMQAGFSEQNRRASEAASIVSGQNLGLLTATANPSVPVSGKALREDQIRDRSLEIEKEQLRSLQEIERAIGDLSRSNVQLN